MLQAAKRRDIDLLRQVLRAMGSALTTEQVKRSLRQSKALLKDTEWDWLNKAMKGLHKNLADPGKYWLTSFKRQSEEKLSVMMITKISESEAQLVHLRLSGAGLSKSEYIRGLIRADIAKE